VSETPIWIAHDPASQHVLEMARKVAETSTTILITGESGTAKINWRGSSTNSGRDATRLI